MTRAPSQRQRLKRQARILSRLEALIEEDPELLAADLCCALLPILARKYPADTSLTNRAAIKQNYHGATPALMAERALSPYGLDRALELTSVVARIALDYMPGSSATEAFAKDEALGKAANKHATTLANAAYEHIQSLGFTPFGATAFLMLAALTEGAKAGLPRYQRVRPLLELVSFALRLEEPDCN